MMLLYLHVKIKVLSALVLQQNKYLPQPIMCAFALILLDAPAAVPQAPSTAFFCENTLLIDVLKT